MFFYSQILMNALMTLASMASASTQTALSDVNVPWDTVWTSVESDVKVRLSSSSSFSLFCHTLSQFIHLGPHYRKVWSLKSSLDSVWDDTCYFGVSQLHLGKKSFLILGQELSFYRTEPEVFQKLGILRLGGIDRVFNSKELSTTKKINASIWFIKAKID